MRPNALGLARYLFLAVLALAVPAEAGGKARGARFAFEGGVLRHTSRGDGAASDSAALNAVVRGSLFLTRSLYLGAEFGAAPPGLVDLYSSTAGGSAYLGDPMAGAFAGVAFGLGPFQVKGELLAGTRSLRLTAPEPDGAASRLVVSGLVLQPRAGIDLWLGRHLTVGLLAGWSRDVVSAGLTLGLHLGRHDGC